MTKEYWDCMSRALGMIERGVCISDEKDRQDVRLNQSYKKLLGLVDEGRRTILVAAQREWLALQEIDGRFEASLFQNTQGENMAGAERVVLHR